MSHQGYFPPIYGQGEFHCPHCNVYAKQFYSHLTTNNQFPWQSVVDQNSKFEEVLSSKWVISKCQRCDQHIVWFEENIIHPKKVTVSPPNMDLDADIQVDYLEAARILSDSPRSSAALLRLALQKLCKQLGEKGDNINQDIKNLVSKGLNSLVQKSLDALRITGNNAVHPGEINLQEEPERVVKLFDLINFIANKMITEPKEIESFYSDLPDKAKAAVENRDSES